MSIGARSGCQLPPITLFTRKRVGSRFRHSLATQYQFAIGSFLYMI
jgi:hypothetical protein